MTSLNPRLEGQGRNAGLGAKPSRLMVQGGGLVTRTLGSGPCSATDSVRNVEAKLHPDLLSCLVPHLLTSVVPRVTRRAAHWQGSHGSWAPQRGSQEAAGISLQVPERSHIMGTGVCGRTWTQAFL